MIHPITMRRDATYTVVPPPEFTPTVRPMRDDELPWAIHRFSQEHKLSRGMRSKTWRDYKALHLQPFRDALTRRDAVRLVVDPDASGRGRGCGWLVMGRWPSIDTLHWVHVERAYRKRKVMTALLDAAELRRNVTYTFLGPARPHHGGSDEWIADLLRARGADVSHVPFAEWSK